MSGGSLRTILWSASLLCACVLGTRTPSPAAQQNKKDQDWKPAILPADALAYGAALNEQAPPKLKAWCEEFAHKEMPKRRIDPRETMAVVDKQFPKNSDEARDAAIYLVFYLSYLAEDSNQRELAHQIRQNDAQAEDLQLQMQAIQKKESDRFSSGRVAPPSAKELMNNQEELQKLEQQLRTLSETQARRMKELSTSRKRVDGYLKVLDVTYKRMDGIEPAILREFQ